MAFSKQQVVQHVTNNQQHERYADNATRIMAPKVFSYIVDQLSDNLKTQIVQSFNKLVQSGNKIKNFDQISDYLQQVLSFQPQQSNQREAIASEIENPTGYLLRNLGIEDENVAKVLANIIQYKDNNDNFKKSLPSALDDQQKQQILRLHMYAYLASDITQGKKVNPNEDSIQKMLGQNVANKLNQLSEAFQKQKKNIKNKQLPNIANDVNQMVSNIDNQAKKRSDANQDTLTIKPGKGSSAPQTEQQKRKTPNANWPQSLQDKLKQQDEQSALVSDSQVQQQQHNTYEIKRTIHPRQGQTFEAFTQSYQLHSDQNSLQSTLQLNQSDTLAVKQQKRKRMAEETVEVYAKYAQSKGLELSTIELEMPSEWTKDANINKAVKDKAGELFPNAELTITTKQPQQQPSQSQTSMPPIPGNSHS